MILRLVKLSLIIILSGLIFLLEAQDLSLYTLPRFPDSLTFLPYGTTFSVQQNKLQLEYPAAGLNRYNDYLHSMNVMPATPFEIDTRGSSYYVPRMVRDELNLIMNRPRETAFVPVLGAAYIAVQLARKYLFVQDKIKITAEDIGLSEPAIPVLKELWQFSPRSLSEIYNLKAIKSSVTARQLEKMIELLIKHKLVKPKTIKNGEEIYFAAIMPPEMQAILEAAISVEMDAEKKRNMEILYKKLQKIPTDRGD